MHCMERRKHLIRSIVQKWLNRQTRLPIILVQLRDIILIRFGVISALSLFFGLIFFIVLFKELGIQDKVIRILLIFGPISLIALSFVLSWIISIRKILEDIRNLRNVSFGFFGGFLGVVLTFIIVSLKYDINLLLVSDGGAVLTGFIHSFARTACLNYGCCHGKEIQGELNGRLHLVYTDPLAKAVRISGLEGRPLYPIQFYESISCLGLGFLTVLLCSFHPPAGTLTGFYFLGYGIIRFICEFYRGEADTASYRNLTVYQWISLGLVLIGSSVTVYSFLFGKPASIVFHLGTFTLIGDFLPFIIGMPFIIFFAYGYHYKTIGRWC